jgi:hypothetical protein
MTDEELKSKLAIMLPEEIEIVIPEDPMWFLWRKKKVEILDEAWLHVCWLVEQTLSPEQSSQMVCEVSKAHMGTGSLYTFNSALLHASWQQRAEALCKVKGMI